MLNGNYNYNMPQYGANVPYQGMQKAPVQNSDISYGAVKDVVPQDISQKLPENLQNIDAEQIANNNGAFSAMSGADSKTMAKALSIYLPFIALRTINDSPKTVFNFAGEWDKTFLGKLAKAGDKISGVISKIIPDSLENGAKNAVKSIKNFAQKHSAVARSLSTPVRLENKTALSEANGLLGRVLFDDAQLFEKGYKGDVVNLFKDKGTGTFWNFVKSQNASIESLPKEEAAKAVSEALRELGNKPKAEIQGCVDDLIDILSKSNEATSIPLGIKKLPIVGRVLDLADKGLSHVPGLNKAKDGVKKFFQLDVPMSEISNKLKVSSGKAGATALGCALPSSFAKIYEGLTSDFVGGKIAPYMQAFFLMQAIKRASEAPKGKKLATFMDEETSAVSFLFTMPLATSLMTKMGGFKYIGMSGNTAGKTAAELVTQQKNNVQLYRDMIKALNEKVDKNLLSRGEYVSEVKKIKDVLKGNTKFWQKPLKALGKLVGSNYKAETIKPFIDNAVPAGTSSIKQAGIQASNMAQTFMYKLKTGGFKLPLLGSSPTPGGILRFALVMFVLSPLVSKPIKAVVNKIFGKPYDPAKEKEEDRKKAEAEAMKNNPFYSMSDAELMTLLSKNQCAIQDLQNHPEKMQEFQKNPQAFYDYLKQNAADYDKRLANAKNSPALTNYINRLNGGAQPQVQSQPQAPYTMTQTMNMPYGYNQQWQGYNNQYTMNNNSPMPSMNYNQPYMTNNMSQPMGMNNMMNQNQKMPAPNVQNNAGGQTSEKKEMVEPKRSYIPSSAPGNFAAQMNAEAQRVNSILNDMENTEKEFSKYLSI